MKSLQTLVFLFAAFLAVSCSDTNGIYDANAVDDSVDAPAVTGQFKKRVLIEDYTGTWCGNCARVAHAIELVMEQSDKAVAVGIHNGNDPFHFAGIQPLKDLISPNNDLGLPQSRLNRTITWTFPEVSNIQQVINLTSPNCGLGLALNSNVVNNNISLDVKIKFAQNYSDLKLVVYVLENHLIYKQENYSNYFGAINPIPNFDHNHVLRASLTNLLGNSLSETSFGQTLSIPFSLAIPSTVSKAANITFVAFVVDKNNTVINVRASNPNENQSFEENL